MNSILTILMVVTAAACTRGSKGMKFVDEKSSVDGSESTNTISAAAINDSLEIVKRILAESRPLDQGDLPMEEESAIADGKARFEKEAQTWLTGLAKYIRFAGIYGARRDERIQFIHPNWLSTGFRSSESGTSLYFQVKPQGPLETFAIGNLRADFGEGLLLGSRDPRRTPLCATRRKGDFRISSSLSCWERTDAVGGRVRVGNVRFGTLVWDRMESDDIPPQRELWLGTSYKGSSWWAGIIAGHSLRSMHPTAIPDTPLRAVAVSMRVSSEPGHVISTRRLRTGVSGEVAVWDDKAFYVFALGLRGRGTGWIRVFRQPATSGFGSSVNGLSRVNRSLHGGALQWRKRFGASRVELSLYDGTVRGASRSSRYRRSTIYVRGQRSGVKPYAWGISASIIERRKCSYNSDALETDVKKSKSIEERLGLQWDFKTGMNLTHRLRGDLRFSDTGRVAGVVISTGGRLSSRYGEMVYRFTNYSLTASTFGYVSRPGVGPFENLSYISERGSDVSLRVKLWFRSWFEILLYYGQPWKKERRLYIGVKYPR
jgi:hypothetical protein